LFVSLFIHSKMKMMYEDMMHTIFQRKCDDIICFNFFIYADDIVIVKETTFYIIATGYLNQSN